MDPDLQNNKSFLKPLVEDGKLLSAFGIEIPQKENFPNFFLKFYPQDFIVEEISKEGKIYTIGSTKPENYGGEKLGNYHMTLVKCNLGTLQAVENLASRLNISVNNIGYAGLKDDDAVTSQRISITGVRLNDLLKIKVSNFFLKEIEENDNFIQKGQLKGNRFTILLRKTENFEEETFMQRLDTVRQKGFYNFYYLQRFGTPRLINHLCGFLILQENYEKVVYSAICEEGITDRIHLNKIRKEAQKKFGDWMYLKNLFKEVESECFYENKLISYLLNSPDDFEGALKEIPDLVTIWIYATSAWLFNHKLSQCIKTSTKIPKTLPLFLTHDSRIQDSYKYLTSKLYLSTPVFKNLSTVAPNLLLNNRFINTISKVNITKVENVEEGIILSFDLHKGEYATTFLSHLVNLISYLPPADMNFMPINIMKNLESEISLNFFTEAKKAVFN